MKQLPSIDTNTDTFYSWIVKTNGIINLCNTEVVTANNHANGAITTGKGYVIGTFGANTISCDVLRGGNTVSNSSLTITSNTTFTANTYKFDPGITLGANSVVHCHGIKSTASNTDVQVLNTFPAATYRSAKYVISVTDATNGAYQATEILVVHNGTNTYMTEYATLTTGNMLATFTTDITTGDVRLNYTPQVAPLTVTVSRTLIAT